MKGIHLTWYEWIGWLVNVLLVAMAIFFIGINILQAEFRATLIALFGFTSLIGLWTWVLLCYGKPKGA